MKKVILKDDDCEGRIILAGKAAENRNYHQKASD